MDYYRRKAPPPVGKDLGRRFEDEEFAEEFLRPIKASLNKERTPTRHCRQGHEQYSPSQKQSDH